MLAPAELKSATWGANFKRVVHARAAYLGIYGTANIARAVGISRNTVQDWWKGSRPEPETLGEVAHALGWSEDDLWRWVYRNGPEPEITPSGQDLERAAREAREFADSATQLPGNHPEPRKG